MRMIDDVKTALPVPFYDLAFLGKRRIAAILSENGCENAQIDDTGQVGGADKATQSSSVQLLSVKAQVVRLLRRQQVR